MDACRSTFDGTTIRLYVNGVQEGTLAGPASVVANSLGLGIGAQPDGVSALQGAMDDIGVYDHALTLAEIQALAGVAPVNHAPVAVADSYSTAQDTAKVVAAPRACSPTTPTPTVIR